MEWCVCVYVCVLYVHCIIPRQMLQFLFCIGRVQKVLYALRGGFVGLFMSYSCSISSAEAFFLLCTVALSYC